MARQGRALTHHGRRRPDRQAGRCGSRRGGRAGAALDAVVAADLCCTLPLRGGRIRPRVRKFRRGAPRPPRSCLRGVASGAATGRLAHPADQQPVQPAHRGRAHRATTGSHSGETAPRLGTCPPLGTEPTRQARSARCSARPGSPPSALSLWRRCTATRADTAWPRQPCGTVDHLPPTRLRSTIVAWYPSDDAGSAQSI
jgi:hypothetical protein